MFPCCNPKIISRMSDVYVTMVTPSMGKMIESEKIVVCCISRVNGLPKMFLGG